jgi:hypothetical protein
METVTQINQTLKEKKKRRATKRIFEWTKWKKTQNILPIEKKKRIFKTAKGAKN